MAQFSALDPRDSSDFDDEFDPGGPTSGEQSEEERGDEEHDDEDAFDEDDESEADDEDDEVLPTEAPPTEDLAFDGEGLAAGLGAALDEDIDVGADDDDEGEEEEFEAEAEAEAEGETEGEGETTTAAPRKAAPKSTSKKIEADEEIAHPDTPVPSEKKMRAAMEWAFEGEDEVTPELLDAYTRYAVFMLEKNREMNLTTIFDPKEVAAKHFLDCWRITRLVPLIARRVLDLGSGGGLPGIPLALAEPNVSMTLVDSTHTKADFLAEAIELLGLRNARAVWDRAEEYLTTERVDVVVVRAVSSVRENVRVLRKVRHSLQDLVMIKGKTWSREVRAAEREAERLGFKLDTVWEHELPGEMGQRAILVYRAPGGAGL